MQYTLAVLLTSFTVQYVKFLAGRPRPDMFSRCWPDKTLLASKTLEFRRNLSMNPDDFISTCNNDTITQNYRMSSAFNLFQVVMQDILWLVACRRLCIYWVNLVHFRNEVEAMVLL